jgi:hypothetical protein
MKMFRTYGRQIARAQFAQYGMTGEIDDAILDNYAKDMFKNEDTIAQHRR